MRIIHVLGAALALAAIAGCSDTGSTGRTTSTSGSSTITGAQQNKVDRAAAMARAIRANPNNADQVLRDHNMTEEQFEALMYEIAADPMMTADFNNKVGR